MPGTGVEPTPNPFEGSPLWTLGRKKKFLESKKFLAYQIEHLKIRFILKYFVDLSFLALTAPICLKKNFSDPGTVTGP